MAPDSYVEPIKSPNDKKHYRYLSLPNGLTVLLIHDPEITSQQPPKEGDDGNAQVWPTCMAACLAAAAV
jgi:hypothetical protein